MLKVLKKLKKKPKIRAIICCFISVFSLSLVFVGGIFYSDTSTEKIAEYASNVVKNKTKNRKYCCITVEKKTNEGSLLDPASEFHNLYGVFKQERITFASCINADKKHEVRMSYSNAPNLSFFYLGPVGSVQYKNHYKHYVYPIETMFTFSDVREVGEHEVSISQSQADKILEQKGVSRIGGEYSEAQYESLLKQPISISIDGECFNFAIQNIYLETNYYFEGLNDVMGDFVLCSYYLPINLHTERKNLYFLNEYTYQNRYFMSYINNAYDHREHNLKVNHFNLTGDIDDDFLVSFYSKYETRYDWLTTTLFVVCGLGLLVSLFLLLNIRKRKIYVMFGLTSIFIPYLIFLVLSNVVKNVVLFSEISTKVNAIFIIVFLAIFFVANYAISYRKSAKVNLLGIGYYEIDV